MIYRTDQGPAVISPVVLYMKGTPDLPQCGFSAQTVAALRACKTNFAHVNIFEDPEVAGLGTYSSGRPFRNSMSAANWWALRHHHREYKNGELKQLLAKPAPYRPGTGTRLVSRQGPSSISNSPIAANRRGWHRTRPELIAYQAEQIGSPRATISRGCATPCPVGLPPTLRASRQFGERDAAGVAVSKLEKG